MKTVRDTLLGRRSIRRYEREQILPEQMSFIYDAIRNTPTSYNGQQFSVIDIDDQAMKELLYSLTDQKQIKTCSHFLVFCIDYYKIAMGAEAKGVEMPDFPKTADGVIVGVVDAALAMMSAIVAAESLGLGTCPIGYARTAAPDEISRILELPKGVFVVCGLALGVPREQPDLKPKQPDDLMFFHNKYSTENIPRRVLAYDQVIKEYNSTRAGQKSDNDWVKHIISYYTEAMNYNILAALQDRGLGVER
ncbi:MAG: nitroreductase family protein [Muribaculaceae bacterium]|nr:nitroreductase family protein [Muribaculaceae bacterium]